MSKKHAVCLSISISNNLFLLRLFLALDLYIHRETYIKNIKIGYF
jgi:hypothetical protein